jgi:hypothetical protein
MRINFSVGGKEADVGKTLTIEVPDYLDEGQIEDYFRENFDDLMSALDLELDDDRAQIDEIGIESFELSEDSVRIEYVIQYSAYYGCDDMNYEDEDQRVVTGRRSRRNFEFDVFMPPPPRSTFEEY